MKRIAVRLVLLSFCLALAPLSWAAWGTFVSTGTATGIGNPSCAFVSTGEVACAVRSGTSAIMVNQFNGTKWGTWKSLAGTVSSDPSCTSDGAGKVFCAATATNGGLLVSILSGGKWSTPATVAAALYSAPSCAEVTAGEVLCVARNASGGLAWSLHNGAAWSAFKNLTASTVSAPGCTADHAGGVICMVFTTGSVVLANRFSGGAWEGFVNFGGYNIGEPGCTSLNSGGEVACWAKGVYSNTWIDFFNGGSWGVGDWSGWGEILTLVNDNASCAAQAAGQLVCGQIGNTDSAFYANVYNGSGWLGGVLVGGAGFGSPSCAPLGTGQVVCVIMGINNRLSSVVGP